MGRVVVIGAGLAGLAAALCLRKEGLQFEIFEKEKRIGGLCRTDEKNGCLFDYTGHLLHFRDETFKSFVLSLNGLNLEHRKRNAWVFSNNVFTKYPFQVNLYGLPQDIVIECVYEYSRRHFNPFTGTIANFREWIDAYFGSGIARHFMVPYNTKLYKRDLSDLTPDCGSRFIPKSDLKMLLRGALNGSEENLGYNSSFYYPQKGGIEAVVKALAADVKVNKQEKVVKIIPNQKKLITSSGREFDYSCMISTQPLYELIESCEGDIDRIRSCAENLRYVSVLNVNVVVSGQILNKHWIYVPEEKFIFHRIGFTHNFSDFMALPGHSSIYLEISYDPRKGLDKRNTVEQCINNLINMRIISNVEQIEFVHTIDIPHAYVIFDHNRTKSIHAIKQYLREKSIYTAGRFGAWDYFSMEDAFLDGWRVVLKNILPKKGSM
ncbi:MAG TPA: FAD-dependent oxidoreductase [Chitinispirillaceae bacterium]|nr:FAD-dependent oxidoreductase [Chitinispirillaceae bacterium]